MRNAPYHQPSLKKWARDEIDTARGGDADILPAPRILCVDDDPDISRAIEIRLEGYEVEVIHAYFGTQGYWEAITHHPDLIIMDLAMPNGSGKFLLESLRANEMTREIPVIVLTGMRNLKLRNEVFSLGADQFLRKPVCFDELIHECARFLDLKRRRTESRPAMGG